jgi:hypothetical protein
LEDFLQVLAAPLESIVKAENQVRFDALVDQWDLPSNDLMALRRWGLPRKSRGYHEPQQDNQPTLVPNVVGEDERRLISPDQRLYRLGWWGPPSHVAPVIGAVAGEGRVLAIRDAPLSPDDLPPVLRGHYENFHTPSILFLNSSVAQYVEVSWRWRAAAATMAELEMPANSGDFSDFHRKFVNARRDFLRGLIAIDRGINADDPHSLWPDQVING